MQEPKQRTGSRPAQGKVMVLCPVLPLHFEKRCHGKRVNGAFCHRHTGAVLIGRGQRKAVTLIAPVHILLKAAVYSPQAGITRFPLAVFSYKYAVMVLAALIQNPFPDTPADHIRINPPAHQIGYRRRPAPVFLREQKRLFGFLSAGRFRRCPDSRAPFPAERLHR